MALENMVRGLDEKEWEGKVLFDDWTIKDEISHLAVFDRFAFLSVTAPDRFRKKRDFIVKNLTDFDQTLQKMNAQGNVLTVPELLSWWRTERERLLTAYAGLDPGLRVPWFGPSMSARSSATARLMETWAHGQDIMDTLGVKRKATERLRHIAHMGVNTFAWAFKNRRLPVPEESVRVDLMLPNEKKCSWGPVISDDNVNGSCLDFCLAATQRRNVQDTDLKIQGIVANRWMAIIQAFAGPPENAPSPGYPHPVF